MKQGQVTKEVFEEEERLRKKREAQERKEEEKRNVRTLPAAIR